MRFNSINLLVQLDSLTEGDYYGVVYKGNIFVLILTLALIIAVVWWGTKQLIRAIRKK